VVLDLSSSPGVDLAGARMLATMQAALQEAGVPLRLVTAHATVRDILRAEGMEERVGRIDRRVTLADAMDEFQGSARKA
jgi:SulP family sulfate permease